FRLEIEPRLAELDGAAGGAPPAADGETAWVLLDRLDAYGVPAPVRKLLDGLSGPLL
ncbi:A/G-specific adenine glycosylase, partial [Burkholderia pseudomallei]